MIAGAERFRWSLVIAGAVLALYAVSALCYLLGQAVIWLIV